MAKSPCRDRESLALRSSLEAVAENVTTAVRERRFWILTHENAAERVRSRFEPILEERNPVLHSSMPGAKD